MERKEQALKISQIEIIPFRPKAGHLGFASCVINEQFYLGDIAIFSRPLGGIRLGYSVKKLTNGTSVDVFKPLNEEVDQAIEKAVTKKFEQIMSIPGPEHVGAIMARVVQSISKECDGIKQSKKLA